jgi:hypothetical protein
MNTMKDLIEVLSVVRTEKKGQIDNEVMDGLVDAAKSFLATYKSSQGRLKDARILMYSLVQSAAAVGEAMQGGLSESGKKKMERFTKDLKQIAGLTRGVMG